MAILYFWNSICVIGMTEKIISNAMKIIVKIIRSLVSGLARFRVTMPRVFSLKFAKA